MNFTKLVPNIFYIDIKDGLRLFVDCLEFTIGHNEINSAQPFCVVEKNGSASTFFRIKNWQRSITLNSGW